MEERGDAVKCSKLKKALNPLRIRPSSTFLSCPNVEVPTMLTIIDAGSVLARRLTDAPLRS